jgi:hypothetical protein
MGKRKTPKLHSANNKGIQAETIQAKSVAVGEGAMAVVNEYAPNKKDEIAGVFEMLKQRANMLGDDADRKDAHQALDAIEREVRRGEKAQEKTAQKWFNFLMETAPDIWDVAIDTFTNPIKGVSTIFRKVAERAKTKKTDMDNN